MLLFEKSLGTFVPSCVREQPRLLSRGKRKVASRLFAHIPSLAPRSSLLSRYASSHDKQGKYRKKRETPETLRNQT